MLYEFVALMSVLALVAVVVLVMRLMADDRRREEAEHRGY
jgi:hypothetical protein